MIYGIIKWTIISLILIMLAHHLFSFFQNTLTVPKVKDLVNQPTKSYKEIEETLSSNTIKIERNVVDPKEMKNELKNFFSELTQNKSNANISNANISATPISFSQNTQSNPYSEIR